MESLAEAKVWLHERLEEGVSCPCCDQFAKLYRRKVYASMARSLIRMWRSGGTRHWVEMSDVATAGGSGGDEAKMRYWGLIEKHPDVEGFWRVTQLGADFVNRYVTIPKYCLIYDGECVRLEGEPVTIDDALGLKFDYEELMAGV